MGPLDHILSSLSLRLFHTCLESFAVFLQHYQVEYNHYFRAIRVLRENVQILLFDKKNLELRKVRGSECWACI